MLTVGDGLRYVGEITLIDGGTIDSAFLRFDPSTYQFYLGQGSNAQNLTDQITRLDKMGMVPNFDIEFENDRIYVANYVKQHGKLPPEVGSDSVWWNFFENVRDDLASEPDPTAQKATIGALGIALGFYLAWRWLKR